MSEESITLPDLDDGAVMALIGGCSLFQMHALQAQDMTKIQNAANVLHTLAVENPDRTREVLLDNRDALRIGQMPDDMLDALDLAVRDGRLCRPDGDDGWTEVDIDAE